MHSQLSADSAAHLITALPSQVEHQEHQPEAHKQHPMLMKALLLERELVDMRRSFHKHPELPFEELESTAFAREFLSALGFGVASKQNAPGLIASLGTGKTIAIRADMDGLPLQELNTVEHISRVHGVMHACGHDAHMACVLTAAKMLAADKLAGGLRIIMQPGESGGADRVPSGTAMMIERGAMTNVDAVLGLHVDTTLPTGKIAVVVDQLGSYVEEFTIRLTAQSKGGINACLMSGYDLLRDLLSAVGSLVIDSFSTFDEAETQRKGIEVIGRVSASTREGSQILIKQLTELVEVDHSAGIGFQSRSSTGDMHALVAEAIFEAACTIVGPQSVTKVRRRSWTENFATYAEHAPAGFMLVGALSGQQIRTHRTAGFDIDERCLPIASAVLCEAVKRLMQ